MNFLAFFVSLPSRQTAGRMRIWRSLRALGCVTLRDGVYLLPGGDERATQFARIADEVKRADGTGELFLLDGRDEAQRAHLHALFDRSADYAALLAAIAAADPGDAKGLRSLKRELAALAAIDYFPGEAQRQAQAALAALEAAAGGEPLVTAGEIRRLASADFQGRTWATRKNLWVDRMASAWLIRRFIDRQAKLPLARGQAGEVPEEALGFDFDGAAFTHVGGASPSKFWPPASAWMPIPPAENRRHRAFAWMSAACPVAEAAGIEAVLAGARASAATDDELLARRAASLTTFTKTTKQESPYD
jgi:hypothetical protein